MVVEEKIIIRCTLWNLISQLALDRTDSMRIFSTSANRLGTIHMRDDWLVSDTNSEIEQNARCRTSYPEGGEDRTTLSCLIFFSIIIFRSLMLHEVVEIIYNSFIISFVGNFREYEPVFDTRAIRAVQYDPSI